MLRSSIVSLVIVTAAVAGSSSPAHAGGPPTLVVDTSPEAFDDASRGAVLLVDARRCGHVMDATLTATAVGLVDGKVTSVEVPVRKTSREGTYAIARTWPAGGEWVLGITWAAGSRLLGETVTAVVHSPGEKGRTLPVHHFSRAMDAHQLEAFLNRS